MPIMALPLTMGTPEIFFCAMSRWMPRSVSSPAAVWTFGVMASLTFRR